MAPEAFYEIVEPNSFVGGKIIVQAAIYGGDEPAVAPDYRMTNEGEITVYILRKCQEGQFNTFAECRKSVSKIYGTGVSCNMGDLSYSIRHKSDTHLPKYTIFKEKLGHCSMEDVSEEKFLELSKDMVEPASIDKLYEVLLKKVKFQFPDKSIQQQKPITESGNREVGGWSEERSTNLSFEEMMSAREIATRIQKVDPKELTASTQQKGEIQTH